MKRILSSLACVAIAALVGVGVASAAQKHVRHSAPARVAVATVASASGSCLLDASLCGPHCPTGSCSSASATTTSATSKAKTPAAFSYDGKACTVSDASQCPASCPRTSASTAVAAKVASR